MKDGSESGKKKRTAFGGNLARAVRFLKSTQNYFKFENSG